MEKKNRAEKSETEEKRREVIRIADKKEVTAIRRKDKAEAEERRTVEQKEI